MKKTRDRMMALLLAALLCLGSVPFSAETLAETLVTEAETAEQIEVTEEKAAAEAGKEAAEEKAAAEAGEEAAEEKAAEAREEARRTPVMGWSSWNAFYLDINEEKIIAQADALVDLGLAEAGYTFLNIDDGYQNGRDYETGEMKTDYAKFPNGMKHIADYAHEKGLFAGIYTDAGNHTCGYSQTGGAYGLDVGLYGYEERDLSMYLDEWGYDFIKVDWCGGTRLGLDRQTQYTKISEIIRRIGRETGNWKIFNICCWAFPGEWAVETADSWRTGGDIKANFDSVLYQLDMIKPLAEYNGPGHVNDLDMMMVGNGMNYEEDKSHFSMWCMMSTPLMLGSDLLKLPEETLAMIKNKELIAIDQDPACIQATVAKTMGDAEIWVKDLGYKGSGSKAVALLNRGDAPRSVTVDWADVGLSGEVLARDLWLHEDLAVGDSYTVDIPAHGVVVLKVSGTPAESGGALSALVSAAPAEADMTAEGGLDWLLPALPEQKETGEGRINAVLSAGVSADGAGGTRFTWSDGTKSGAGSDDAALFIPAGETVTVTIPASETARIARFYIGGEARFEAVAAFRRAAEVIVGDKAVTVQYADGAAEGGLTVTISGQGAGAVFGGAAVRSAVNGTAVVTVSDKPAEVDLTALGTGDWLYVGHENGSQIIRKAGGGAQLDYAFGNAGANSGGYTNAAATYRWSDGDSLVSGGSNGGQGYASLGVFGEYSAPADERERTLNAFIGGYGARIRIDVLLGDTVLFTDYIENMTYKSDARVTVTYSSDTATRLTVRWTTVVAGDAPSIGIEAVTVSAVPPLSETAEIYAFGTPLSAGRIDLEQAGAVDWVTFEAEDGGAAADKAGAGLIGLYTVPAGAVVAAANSGHSYVWDGGETTVGAAQSASGGDFRFTLPPSDDLREARIYFGVKQAQFSLGAGGGAAAYSGYRLTDEGDYVVSVWYKSKEAVPVTLAAVSAFAPDAALRLDAITLSEPVQNMVAYPTARYDGADLAVGLDLRQTGPDGFDAAAVFFALYDAAGRLVSAVSDEVTVSADAFVTAEGRLTPPVGFGEGTVKAFVWNREDYAPLTEAYALSVPLAEATPESRPPRYIGGLGAKEKVAGGAVLLDVRTAAEFEAGHIEGAVHIAHTDLLSAMADALPDKQTEIIVYCASAKRSVQAERTLRFLGYENVYNLGSMSNWYEEPTLALSKYAEQFITADSMISVMVTANSYDETEIRYAVGADATPEEAVPYTAEGIHLSQSDTVKAYLFYKGAVYLETSQAYRFYEPAPIPDIVPDVYASTLAWETATTGWGEEPRRNRSIGNNVLSLGGNRFDKGIGTHAASSITFRVPANATWFVTVGGADDEVGDRGTYTQYLVYLDDRLVEASYKLKAGQYHVFDFEIPAGAGTVTLAVDYAGDTQDDDHGSWGIAGFVTGKPTIPTSADYYISDMAWISSENGWETIQRDRSIDKNALNINGMRFDKGIGTHAFSEVVVAVPDDAKRFVAVAGCDDEVLDKGYFTNYAVYIDGVLAAESRERMRYGDFYIFDVAIPEGAQTLRLVAGNGNNGSFIDFAHCDWGVAGFNRE